MLDEPRITQTIARPIAVIHLTVPPAEIRSRMCPGHRELMAADPTNWRTQLDRPLVR